MKISHKSKRVVPPHPQIASLIADILAVSNEDLSQYLASIDNWKWPRSDLNSWIKVLNRFDTILEEVIRDYDVDRLQTTIFTPRTKATVCEILKFERLLLENSTNRKMFNSYDRLNSLLFSSDLDVLVASLLLLLRPSQQYSAQPALSHALHISTSRLASLAGRPPILREYGVDMLDLVSEAGKEKIRNLPQEASEVSLSFYRRGEEDKDKTSKEKEPSAAIPDPTTQPPRAPGSAQSGPVNIHLGPMAQSSRESMDVLADAIQTYDVPDGEKYELLCRIRNAQALGETKQEEREKLVVIRLLSIAVYAHTHTEAVAQSSLFLYEPDLVTRIAELLQLDRAVPVIVQTAAIAALDALARYRGKIQEVLTAVNAGVNHGILMSLLRKTVAEIASPHSTLSHLFVDALLSFVIYIASHAAGGNMVVGAGLVPLLIQIIENKLPERLQVVSKTMQLVDNVLYGFTNAFQIFCNGRGVEVLAERIQYEVDLGIENQGNDERCFSPLGSYGLLPFARTGVIKHTLRSMHRMMQSSGTTEGLRGLIDSSLLASVKKIIGHRGLFGPTVLPIAINIMATFVHNEPTSLVVIQEAGLPEAFYEVIESGLEASIEVIQSIPNAIGALCLNQAGQDQLASRPSIIPGLLTIFTSERHLKVMQDKENSALIGSAIDELIRHHPSLKAIVFDALKSTLSKIEDMGSTYTPPSDIEQWYKLVLVSHPSSSEQDVVMEDTSVPSAVQDPAAPAAVEGVGAGAGAGNGADEALPKPHDNLVVSFIDILSKFLEGLFQHISHCKDFVSTTDCLARLTRMLALPCMPYDFANSVHSDSLVQVIRTMTEVAPTETLGHLAKEVKVSLEETRDFWQSLDGKSHLLPYIDVSDERKLLEANNIFRRLLSLHNQTTMLSDVYTSAGYTHGRGAVGLLPALSGPGSANILEDLGALHRACLWENILLKTGLSTKADATAAATTPSAGAQPPAEVTGVSSESLEQTPLQPPSAIQKEDSAKLDGPSECNARALKHVASQIPTSLAPLFQSVARMFMYGRRHPDPTQKKQAAATCTAVATVMLKHLKQQTFGDALSTYAYYTVMLGLITVLLFDERTPQHSIHAMLLVKFRQIGGLDAVLDISRRYSDSIARINAVDASDRTEEDTQELVHLYGGLKVALHLLHSLVSFKTSSDSNQNTLFTSQDIPETDPEYYESHDLLVKMRLAALPFIRDLWRCDWLVSAPPGVSKYVIQSVLDIVGGEREESGAENNAEVPLGNGPGLLRPSGPDEDRISQLTDMGFPRTAAVRALTRSHNNVSVATEFLLAHPFPFPNDPDMDTSADVADPDDAGGDDAASTSAMENNDADESRNVDMAAAGDNPPSEAPPTGPTEGTCEERRNELNLARETLTADLGTLALRLIDSHPSLIFDVKRAFTGSADGYQAQAVRSVVDDIRKFSPSAFDVHEEPLAVRCRLLALILSDSPSTTVRITGSNEQSLMDLLLALLLSNPAGVDQPTIPKWLACHLLVTESLLVLADEPRSITLPLADEPIKHEEILAGPSYSEARPILFDFAFRLLGVLSLPRDELLATLRLLVQLTRDHALAGEFVRRDGVALLLKRLQGPSGETSMVGCQSYIAIIFRHVVENQSTLESIMRQEVRRWFTQPQPRARVVDVTSFVRTCAPMAARDPQTFVKVTQSLCQLLHPDATVKHIALKMTPSHAADAQPPTDMPEGTDKPVAMQVDLPEASSNVSSDVLESVVHFMVGELLRVGKLASEKINSEGASTSPKHPNAGQDNVAQPTPDAASSSQVQPNEEHGSNDASPEPSNFFYACFLMQCLTELLFSYDTCKHAFLSFSTKKRGTTPSKDGSRHKTQALTFLLTDLVSFGAFNVEPKFDAQKRMMLCNWAMSVIVALCIDCSSSRDAKDVSTDLLSIRKTVLEAVSRSIKDAPSLESDDTRYGRLLALAELCHRLLTVRFNANANKSQDETPIQIAKVMLEKNFVATLTSILSDIDLNYPNMRSLVVAILRPLEHLTKIAIKMGRSTDKSKVPSDHESTSSNSVASEEGEEDAMDTANGREETPDLYRNSSLGMYRGEMEDVNFAAGDEMDQAEDEDDEEVDMEFDEDTGSEDTSNSDEEGDGEEDLELGAQEAGEVWTDDEDMEDEDEDEDAHSEDNESDRDPEEGSVDDAEIMWQDIPAVVVNDQDGGGDEGDEDEERDGMPTIIDDDEVDEEGEEMSEEDLPDELGVLEGPDGASEDPFGIGRQILRGIVHEDRLLFTNGASNSRGREDGDADMQVFGRPRQITTGQPEPMPHPLLIDTTASSMSPAGQPRVYRRTQRGVVSGNTYSDLLHTIEELVGGGAIQLFQQLMTRTRSGIGPDIRVEVPASSILPGGERVHVHRHGRTPLAASVRLERDVRISDNRSESHDFSPLPTLQRWTEEAKISHGKFLNERFGKLCNHITLALLPDAREAAQKAREKEEKERAERAEKDAAAAKEAAELAAAQPSEESGDHSEEEAAHPSDGGSQSEEVIAPLMEPPVPVIGDLDTVMAEVQGSDEEPTALPIAPPLTADENPDQEPIAEPTTPPLDIAESSTPTPAAPTAPTEPPEASTSIVPERVTVMIHGNAVDITDTGIDPTFLEALPDDMREEVLNQHFRERRSARVEQPPESTINPEFLEALPPEIRAEILQQERLERTRRERTQNEASAADSGDGNAAAPSGPAEIDPASFIASLDPQLRQVVLLDQDDVFLQSLPSHMIAEAGVYREVAGHVHHHVRREAVAPANPTQVVRKPTSSRDAIQLLDRSSIATLVRLLFFPQLFRKNILHKVLLNLCENSKSRTDLFNLLLSILQDGSGDLVMVDRSFAQMSVRNSKASTVTTPKPAGKQKASGESAPPNLPNGIPPELIAQRCLDALSFIVSSNELSSLFFLTEHELPAGLRRVASKKGKGKEKQTAQSHYPIVLLLGLLDRQTLLTAPSIMDSVAGLLASVTRPLMTLKDAKRNEVTTASQEAGSDQMATATSEAVQPAPVDATATPNEPSSSNSVDIADAVAPAPQTAEPAVQEKGSTSVEAIEEKMLLANPPQIPHPALRLIVNILTVGECSGRTFQQTLALIQHLTCIPDARDVIAQELKAKAQEFGQILYTNLDELVKDLEKSTSPDDLPTSSISKFSPASSDQAKLLRVLKTIDYMYSKAPTPPTSQSTPETADEEDTVHAIYESFRFAPLWRRLGDCLAIVEQKPDVEHIATILLPLIESLMVVCKYVGSKPSAASRAIRASASPRSPTTSRESMEDLFVSFTDAHRKVLNLMVRNNPSLMSGSFSLLIHNPRVLDFDNKRNYFNQQVHRRPHPREHYGTLQLNVRRARVFEDSFQYLQRKTGDQIKYGKLSVRFYDEEGVDAGGVTREWFQILARQMFNPNYALFEPCAADKQTYQPNRASAVNSEHLSFFKFVGRVIGKAIYDGRLLDAYFARSLYRQLLGKPVDYRDVEWVDPEYYKSLCWILENDPTALDLTFITEVDEFGKRDIIPLKEGGASVPVTQDNKREYVQLSAQYRLYSSIKDQIESLLGGFYEVVPKELISIFNEQEVELLISGTPDIDVDEWRAATEYNGYTSSDPVIVWWWRALKSFNRDERAKVLSFATGTARVPLGGFVELQGVQGVQRFSIHRAYGDSDRLPQAHTCFNQIDLPQYSSYEMLRQQLLLAINEGGEGFGFA
ncbi:hypothetical protein BD410DRAFT_895667 [Rickenella mellea]|uniref:HECT-type E3 ubiquitin transferase n=1 Tax=Rickenella mellea TaxID=50990 RepID=A0A4Y7QG83_9AGAM|nr:hypothetical protein BD410DRAFT_895667 [Rickenella mellea]